MKHRYFIGFLFFLLLVACLIIVMHQRQPSKQRAEQRAMLFADAVNYSYNEPDKIYELMASSFKEKMSESEFSEAFTKERSYPYLTPLFINFRECKLSDNLYYGTAFYSQAARLPGMKQEIKFVYENGDYYFQWFDDLADGSYLTKFDNITYSLDMYFDHDALAKGKN